VYKFKAENGKERELWIKSIKIIIKKSDEKSVKDSNVIEAIVRKR